MKQVLSAALAALVLLVTPAAAFACAACGNPSLPQRPTGAGLSLAGTGGLGVAVQSSALWVSHPAGCADLSDCDAVPVQPEHTHDLLALPTELTISGHYALTDRVGLEAAVPARVVVMRASYETPDGASYTPIDEGVHHRDETVAGIGDAEFRVRGTVPLGRWWGTGRLGVTLPLGHTEPDPFAAGDRGEEHQHVQLGTGTFNPTVALEATRGLRAMQWSFYAVGRAALYENRHGYRAGPRGMVGVSGGWKAPRPVLVSGAVEAGFEGPERWQGEIQQDGLIGRTEIHVGPDILWFAGATTVGASLRFPVYRNLVENDEPVGDLRAPVSAAVTLSWAFDT